MAAQQTLLSFHQHEMDPEKSELEAARHTRDLEHAAAPCRTELAVCRRGQAALADAAMGWLMADAFLEGQATGARTGISWVDAWVTSGSGPQELRSPGCLGIADPRRRWFAAGLVLSEFDQTLISAFLGVFVGDRIHAGNQSQDRLSKFFILARRFMGLPADTWY